MNCSKHPNRVAVAQCAECGDGICRECAERTRFLKDDFGALCLDCYENKISEMCDYLSEKRGEVLKRIIISCIFYVIGIIILALTSILGATYYNIIFIAIGVLLCGFYTGLSWKKAAEEDHKRYEEKHGVTYIITDTGIKRDTGCLTKVIFFILGLLFGIVITPIRVIIDCVKQAKLKKSLNFFQQELNSL